MKKIKKEPEHLQDCCHYSSEAAIGAVHWLEGYLEGQGVNHWSREVLADLRKRMIHDRREELHKQN